MPIELIIFHPLFALKPLDLFIILPEVDYLILITHELQLNYKNLRNGLWCII